MLRRLVFAGVMIFLALFTHAQSPEAFKYQAVARDGSGQILMNQSVSFRINILQGSTTGSTIYSESHTLITNSFGLVNLAVGDGTVLQGDFANIAWGTDDYFLQIEMDATGGTDYQVLGTAQLLSVPYALHSKTADNVPGDNDADSSNEIQNISISGNTLSLSNGGGNVTLPPDTDAQSLSLSGNSLSIDNGNTVDLSNVGQPSLWSSTGSDIYYTSGNVGIGTSTPESELHLEGDFYLNSGQGAFLIGFPDNGDRWRLSTLNSGESLLFRSKPDGSNSYTTRVVFDQDGKVAIGGNTSPDEALVVGQNVGTAWSFPAVTAGNSSGGAIAAGSSDYNISMSSSNTFGRARIISTSPTGYGEGEIEMRTDGLSIGEAVGSPGAYMLKIEHSSFGFNMARAGTSNDWEFLTSSAAGSNLLLYANGALRGTFSGTNGAYSASSDRRLKKDIHQMEAVLPRVMHLKPSRYKYIDNNPQHVESIGFVAQEVQEQFPELVNVIEDERSKGMLTVNYSGFGVIAIKAIQEQQAEIKAQAKKIEAQQGEIDALQARIAKIEALLNK